jgi:hypothetical protein
MPLAEKYFSESFLQIFNDPKGFTQSYKSAQPYPHAIFDNVFDPAKLREVLAEFPDLSTRSEVIKFNNANERKIASEGESQFSDKSLALMHFLNSLPFLHFLEELTDIPQLISDPHFVGGGFHEIKPGGFLKVHVDFNKHYTYGLDRRLNVLIYLNENWDESYGGHFELWGRDMSHCVTRVSPLFNRLVVFSTIPGSFHGHPHPLTCPPERSRRSLALYYYTHGRPADESTDAHSTVWRPRQGIDTPMTSAGKVTLAAKQVLKDLTPPLVLRMVKKLM